MGNFIYKPRCRVTFFKTNDFHTLRVFPADDVFRLVVTALDENIRTEFFEQLFRRIFVKDDHVIDASQSAEQKRSIFLRDNGTCLPLQAPTGRIGIEADNEAVSPFSCQARTFSAIAAAVKGR